MSGERKLRGGWATLALATWLAGVGNSRLWIAAGDGADGLSPLALFALFLVLLSVFNGILQVVSW